MSMYSPETHETQASVDRGNDSPEEAKVSAMLAIAAAIEDLAEAVRGLEK